MVLAAVEDARGWFMFAFVMLGIEIVVLVVALFAALALRGLWRWLRRGNWNNVVVSALRKAMR